MKVDAKRDLVLKISDGDFKRSKAIDPFGCVLAQSCLRKRPGSIVSIGSTTAIIRKGRKDVRYLLSTEAKKSIRQFDQSKGKIWPCRTVRLLAPKGALTLDVVRRKATVKRKAEIKLYGRRLRGYNLSGRNSPKFSLRAKAKKTLYR